MIRAFAIGAVASIIVAFLAGMAFSGLPELPASPTRNRSEERHAVIRPGEGIIPAVRFLRTLLSDPPPPAPPPPPVVLPPPPPPPPPDVAIVFKAALRGVEKDDATGAWRVIVADGAPAAPQRRFMNVGDIFGDGWRILAISETQVRLGKGRDARVIPLYG